MSRTISKPQAKGAPEIQRDVLQRKCACGQYTGGGECNECRTRKQSLQRQKKIGVESDGVPPIVHEVLHFPGQPLDTAARSLMERRFGQNFSRVRVHTDEKAAESARLLNASAYAVGTNIAFAEGEYMPGTMRGQVLLAHELTHVLQQGGHHSSPKTLRMGKAFDHYENEAAAASVRSLTGSLAWQSPYRASTVEPGTVQTAFPWLIAAAVAGIAAGGYAWWAHNCLSPVELPMYRATFGDDYSSGRSSGFRLWYHNRTRNPVPSNAWDAFGHCYSACAATQRCGATATAIVGKGREFYREHIDSAPHDSYSQDTNNQTLGRGFGDSGADCENACSMAAIPPGAMDLTAPVVNYWTPARGEYVTP